MSQSAVPRTSDELHAVLARFPGWGDKSFEVTPVVGGLTNSNYRVDVDGEPQSYFVKVPGPGTEGFIDRATASAASVQAAEMGVGPTVFYFDPETGIEVSEFLDGYQPCTAWDVGQPDVCAELMGLFRTWHSGPALPQTKTVFDMVEEHREQVLRDGTVMPAWVPEVLAAYDEAKARFLAAGMDIVPCHNDPGAGNYMRSITEPKQADEAHRLRLRLEQRARVRDRRLRGLQLLRRRRRHGTRSSPTSGAATRACGPACT